MDEKLSIGEEARKKVVLAKKRLEDEALEKKNENLQKNLKLQEEMTERAQHLFIQCKKEVLHAADNGKSELSFYVLRKSREQRPDWCYILVPILKELLNKEGLCVEVKETRLEPDSEFPYSLYYIYLGISWN